MLPQTDDEGYIVQPEAWTKAFAESTAAGVLPDKLEEDHWRVIDYLRDYFCQFDSIPPLRMLCKRTGINAPYLRKLFPCGLLKGACKIAGIPQAKVLGRLYP